MTPFVNIQQMLILSLLFMRWRIEYLNTMNHELFRTFLKTLLRSFGVTGFNKRGDKNLADGGQPPGGWRSTIVCPQAADAGSQSEKRIRSLSITDNAKIRTVSKNQSVRLHVRTSVSRNDELCREKHLYSQSYCLQIILSAVDWFSGRQQPKIDIRENRGVGRNRSRCKDDTWHSLCSTHSRQRSLSSLSMKSERAVRL